MSNVAVMYRIYELPWATAAEQENRFWRLLKQVLIGVIVLSLVFSFLPVPEPDPTAVEEIPQRFARLIVDQPPPPPPPVVREEPEPEPEVVEPEPIPEQVVEQVVEPEPIPEPEPEPEPVDTVQLARDRASVAGLLPFAQELASLRDNDALDSLDNAALAGSADAESPLNERSLITSSVGSASGGINTAALSRNTGGTGLNARATTQVDSPVEGFGPAGGAVTRSGQSNLGSRSREEIERVFDRNKGAIYALYNRALRQDPTLQGKLVLRLTISPAGAVTFCEVVSSELNDADLEQKLVQRVMLFEFEAKDVEAITTTKPIDFFPA
jgi:outer membrane biosynthesis protein TonB